MSSVIAPQSYMLKVILIDTLGIIHFFLQLPLAASRCIHFYTEGWWRFSVEGGLVADKVALSLC